MMRTFIGFALMLTSTFVIADESKLTNPLQGSWEWVNIKNSCVENYIFGIENSGFITSGEEKSSAEYTISEKPSEKGFYAVSLKIVEDKGGKDCGDSVENNSGDIYKKFVMFHPSGNQYVSCDTEDIKDCVGPFKRIQ